MTDAQYDPDDDGSENEGSDYPGSPGYGDSPEFAGEPEFAGVDESPGPDLGQSLEEVTRYEDSMRMIRLLEATHSFPCPVMVKVIGRAEDDFLGRIVAALRFSQQLPEDPPYRSRETPNGQHVAVTFEPYFENAEEVLAVYEHIRTVHGIVMVM